MSSFRKVAAGLIIGVVTIAGVSICVLGTAPAFAESKKKALLNALVEEVFGPDTAFVTSGTYTPDLVSEARAIDPTWTGTDGLMAGDFICSTVASEAGLGDSYVAYLSTVNTDAIDRLPVDGGPWVTLEGDTVADNRFAVLSFNDPGGHYLDAPIDVTEDGSIVPDNWAVFTSTDGRTGRYGLDPAVTDSCQGWTSLTSPVGIDDRSVLYYGNATRDTYRWAQQNIADCALITAALYCFER